MVVRGFSSGVRPCKLGCRIFRICRASIGRHLRGNSGMRRRRKQLPGTLLPGIRRVRGMQRQLRDSCTGNRCN